MIQKFKFINGSLEETASNDCQVWVYINPDNDEIELIAKEYDIDRHTVESAIDLSLIHI